ncbi:hypothetical protein N2152v2_004527 [Parachlorella kessleri]
MKQVAIKRLLHDLKEVLENPLEDAVALPLEDNLFLWHGNVRSPEGPLADLPLHLLLIFPSSYPTQGPEIRLFHALPHPNIAAQPAAAAQNGGATYRVAYWDCNPSMCQWSPAFSVASILVQLQAFLLSPDLLYDTSKVTHARARESALKLKVQGHPHQGTCPHPPFPTAEDIALAPRLQRVEVVAPSINPDLLVRLPMINDSEAGLGAATDAKGWVVASRKAVRSKAGQCAALSPVASKAAQRATAGASPLHDSTCQGMGLSPVSTLSLLGETEWESLEEMLQPGCDVLVESDATDATEDPIPAPGPPALLASSSPSPSVEGTKPLPRSGRRKPLLDDSILKQRQEHLISNVLSLHQQRRERERHVDAADIKGVPDHRQPAAHLTTRSVWDALTPDALVQVLLRLDASEVAALGSTCRALRVACLDGEVWRGQLRRRFPGSILHASTLADWRIVYALEANCVLPELRCFFSKATWCDEVLGLPMTFTATPRTRRVDHLAATCHDLVALAPFQAGLVTKDLQGHAIKAVLPLYITQDHFQRALPHLPGLLRQLAPHRAWGLQPGTEVPPIQWLQVLPTALNTCAVLMCSRSRGLEVCERALNTYVALHRLLMAVCDHYQLWEGVDRRVARFLSSEAERAKAQVPCLGTLLPLLAVSRRYDWRAVMPTILAEAQDRSILWICKHTPSLEARLMEPPEAPLDPMLLRGAWEAGQVSHLLFQFHATFMDLVARPPGSTLGGIMYTIDTLYGRPGLGLCKCFQAETRRILAVKSWDDYYERLGLRPPTPQQQCRSLRLSCQASLRKGYHRAGMDFARVRGWGSESVATLLKRQCYSAPPDMTDVAIDERWRSAQPGNFPFLDASCLIYGTWAAVPKRLRGAGGAGPAGVDWARAQSSRGGPYTCPPVLHGGTPLALLEVVDFGRRHGLRVGSPGAVVHSGDQILGDSGQHTLTIKLPQLGDAVEALWLTMSAWAGAHLDHIAQPHVCVKDAASDTELCRYFLEDLPPQQRSQHSAVVMCCIHRSPTARRQWQVAAVGELAGGDVSDYRPLLEAVQALPPLHRARG